jgi:hypothetical protein
MASLKESGMGIGDFAEALFQREKANPQPNPRKASVRGNVPDIENVQVLQEDVDAVLSNSFGVRRDTPPKVNLQEERRKHLKEQIQVKINELKELLNELTMGTTTVGSLGAPNYSGGKSCESNKHSKKSKRRAKVRRKV